VTEIVKNNQIAEAIKAQNAASVEIEKEEAILMISKPISRIDKLAQRTTNRIEQIKEPDFAMRAAPDWVGPEVKSLTGDALWDFELLQIMKIWNRFGVKGLGANVYVIDSGIDASHNAFAHHTNLVQETFLPGGHNPKDGNGHGTWVCGKIAGLGIGIAPRCNLHSLRTLDNAGTGSTSFSTAALEWVLKQKDPHVVNLSLGGTEQSERQKDVIKRLWDRGVLVIAAAGNAGSPVKLYPAGYDTLIAVAADTMSGDHAEFSNYGDHIDISAPGVACYSTYLRGTFRKMQGTSMATPIVAGVVALGYSYALRVAPELTAAEIRARIWGALTGSARDLGPVGRDQFHGFGGINGVAFMERLHKELR